MTATTLLNFELRCDGTGAAELGRDWTSPMVRTPVLRCLSRYSEQLPEAFGDVSYSEPLIGEETLTVFSALRRENGRKDPETND